MAWNMRTKADSVLCAGWGGWTGGQVGQKESPAMVKQKVNVQNNSLGNRIAGGKYNQYGIIIPSLHEQIIEGRRRHCYVHPLGFNG